jgi:lipoprotein-anchoring transpeptidase ErfK/SrfK
MGIQSQNLLSSFVRVVIAANIFAVISLGGNPQNDITWAKNLDTKSNSSNPKRFLFIDLQNHWSRLFVEGLLSQTTLNSDTISQFQPDRPITRAELANLLEVAFANRNVPKITTRLNEPATKAEVLVAIARELNLNSKAHKTPQTYLLSMYRDALKVPDYAIPAIATLTQQGLVTNYPDPRILAPTTPITKSELAVLLYQALAYQKKLPALGSLYTINPNRQLWDRELMQVTRLEVSISKRKVTAFHGEIPLKTYPVAVGKEGWSTPIGNHRVLQTIEYPAWQNPFTGDVIPSKDPENPLGDRWIGFWTNGKDWSGFHGTPNRASVGQAASHGCIRMYNEDVRELFSQVTVGTIVRVSP